MSQPYYVIESPSRGTLMEWSDKGASGELRPRFSWSGLRSDPGVMRFYTLERAQKEFDKVRPYVKGQLYFVHMNARLPMSQTNIVQR